MVLTLHTHSSINISIAFADMHMNIALQVTSLQEAATGIQQDSIQHLTVANNFTDTQQSSVQHQPTPQYALPNKATASNKDQEVHS